MYAVGVCVGSSVVDPEEAEDEDKRMGAVEEAEKEVSRAVVETNEEDGATHAESVHVMIAVLVCVTTDVISDERTEVIEPEVMIWPAGQVVVVV